MKKLHRLSYLFLLFTLQLLIASCHSVEEHTNNPRGNFEALWTVLDEHYCCLRFVPICLTSCVTVM